MRSGTTTMKMISSTSTTSTSGVMLISDCRLDPESLLLNSIASFSSRPRVAALSDQPHPPEAGLLDRLHGLSDLAEVELCVAPDHDLGIRLGGYCSAKGVAELLGCDLLIVNPQAAALVDGDQDPAPLVALLARLLRFRQADLRPFPHLRRHHHEDDQQHQHHVDERRDVDGRLHFGAFTEPHTRSPLRPPTSWRRGRSAAPCRGGSRAGLKPDSSRCGNFQSCP